MTADSAAIDHNAAMLRSARALADALHVYARARRDDDRTSMLALQSELCALRSGELRPAMEQPLIQERV